MKSNRSSAIPPHRAHHRLTRAAVAPLLAAALLIAAQRSASAQDAINVDTTGAVTIGNTLTVKTANGGNVVVLGAVQTYGQGTHLDWNRDSGSGSTFFQNKIGGGTVGGFRFEEFSNGVPVERMRLDQTGNLGIGTPNPTNKLSVAGNADFSGNIRADGASFLFTNGSTDGTSAVVLRRDPNWAYLFPWGTGTAQNTVSIGGGGVPTSLHVSGNTFVDGNVGIGTSSPTQAMLVVNGAASYALNGNSGSLGATNVFTNVHNPTVSDGTVALPVSLVNDVSVNASIYATFSILAQGFLAFSDERIKHIEGRSDAARDLSVLLDIEVTDYTYIDVVARGAGKQKKAVAQQLEKVYPQAVSKSRDVVPDIYQQAEINDGWVKLTTDLKTGERVRLIGNKEEGIHEVLGIAEGRFRTDFAGDGPVFVYGREVKDFRVIDYEAIAMLNVSATQQIKKEKDAEVSALQQENMALRAHIEALDQRLSKLEQTLTTRTATQPVESSPRAASIK